MSLPLANTVILILISGHLANAPRVQKEARTLRVAGATVLIRGTWSSDRLADEDVALARELRVEFSPLVDVRRSSLPVLLLRLRQRLASELFSRLGWATARSFGLGAPEFLREALKVNADLTIVHSEAGLWAGKRLVQAGRRLCVDFEDWFSQDLLESDRKGRPVKVLRDLEHYLLRHADACYTTTRSMAVGLARDAGVDRIPKVVPNCFPAAERCRVDCQGRDGRAADAVSLHWFSQTIGPGRGLESLADALLLLKGNWCLHLRGSLHGYEQWFNETFSPLVRKRITLHAPVSNSELLSRVMSHDVGLAIEIPYCLNKELTASNKIFEYLRAGLAVVATRTVGQMEVVERSPDVGIIVSPGQPIEMAAALQSLIHDTQRLAAHRTASLAAGGSIWSWEAHEEVLLNAVVTAVGRRVNG